MELSDQELIKAYLDGDRRAFDGLVHRYLKLIYTIAYRYVHDSAEAEDAVQEVFIKILRHLNSYDPKQSFKTWIVSITKHHCLDWLKKKRPIAFSNLDPVNPDWLEELADLSPGAVERLEQKSTQTQIRQALAKLPKAYQDVIRLRHFSQLNFRETAAHLGEVLNTVKSRHRRGLVMLKKLLNLPE